MFAYNSSPPDPAVVGPRWRELWHERLRHGGLWLEEWLRHQRRDDYWRHGSVCENPGAIQCPVFAVSGWADGYSNAVFRLIESLNVPCKGLIGPWSHKYPHLGVPGPAIGFLQELVRWWDRWLRDVDNDVTEEHSLQIWMQDSVPPSTAYAERPGRWVGEPSWPSPNIQEIRFPLARNRLVTDAIAREEEPLSIESPLSVGQFAGKWCSYNAPPDLPYDQREEDGGSPVFDSDVLTERREILGAPNLHLEFTADAPAAMVAVRLSDVAPEGRATRVTYGLLNLTHHEGHDEPQDLVPGERYAVDVPLNGAAQAFPAGHRIRLSISTSYWPLAWPPPKPARLTVLAGVSHLTLPLRPTIEPDRMPKPAFEEPEGTPPLGSTQVEPGEERWTASRGLVDYRSTLSVVKNLGTALFDDIDLEVTRRADETYSWVGDDFGSVRGEVTWRMGFARGDWQVQTVTRTVLSCTETEFLVDAQLDAHEGGHRVLSRNGHRAIPRDHV